jgi:hypothetical protein
VVAVANGVASNSITLPVQAGGGVCNDQALGANGDELKALSSATVANLGLISVASDRNVALAEFAAVPGNQSGFVGPVVSSGSCIVGPVVFEGLRTGFLDAGAIQVASNGSTMPFTMQGTGQYGVAVSNESTSSFAFSGAGGKDVGAFTAVVALSNPIQWTNMSSISTVNRSEGVTVNWTGGAPNSFVTVSGAWGLTGSFSFTCRAPLSAGQFTVPAWVLGQMPTGPGLLTMENDTFSASFTAAGLTYGRISGAVSNTVSVTYQ